MPINPTTHDQTANGTQDFAYRFSTADFPFIDAGDTLANVIITALPSNGTLTYNDGTGAVAVTAGQSVSAADIGAGHLWFTPDTDLHQASLQFQVQDTTDSAISDPATLTVNFASDGQPTAVDTTVNGTQDTPYTFHSADFQFSDTGDATPDSLANVIITALPGNGTLTYNDGTGAVAVTAGQSISAADIDNGYLTFAPNTDAHSDTLQFNVQDTNGLDISTTPATLSISLASDGQPTTSDNTVFGVEDTPYVFKIADFPFSDTGDAVPDTLANVIITTLPVLGGTLTYNNGSGAVAVSLGQSIPAADIVNGYLTFTPVADAHSDGFQFQVQDANGLDISPAAFLNINLDTRDGQPTAVDSTVRGPLDTTYTFHSTDFGFSDVGDVPPDTLANVIVTTLPGNGTLALDGSPVDLNGGPVWVSVSDIDNGYLTFTPNTGVHSDAFSISWSRMPQATKPRRLKLR